MCQRRPPRPQAAEKKKKKKKKKKKHAALIRNAGGVLPVQSQRRKQAERHRRAFCIVSFPLPFFAWNPPPIGERAINDLIIVCSVALLSLSLSKSSRSIRNENATIVSSLFISHVSVDGMSRAKRRTCARASRRDLTFVQKLTPPIYFGLLFFSWTLFLYTKKYVYYRRWRNRSAPRIPPRKWSR